MRAFIGIPFVSWNFPGRLIRFFHAAETRFRAKSRQVNELLFIKSVCNSYKLGNSPIRHNVLCTQERMISWRPLSGIFRTKRWSRHPRPTSSPPVYPMDDVGRCRHVLMRTHFQNFVIHNDWIFACMHSSYFPHDICNFLIQWNHKMITTDSWQ